MDKNLNPSAAARWRINDAADMLAEELGIDPDSLALDYRAGTIALSVDEVERLIAKLAG